MTGLDRLFHLARVTLCFSGEETSLVSMKVLYAVLIAIIGLASPLSLRADAVDPCLQQGEEATATTQIGDHHGSAHETPSHHGDSNGDTSEFNCDCCLSCVSLCGSSVSPGAALGSQSLKLVMITDWAKPPSSHNYDDLNRNSLFRPPRPNA